MKKSPMLPDEPLIAPPVALTIAGFDPSGGAGITADLKAFSAHHLYGIACITAMTVQSTLGVRSVDPLSAIRVRQTLECLAEDIPISGIKIGMLGSGAVVSEVVSFLDSWRVSGEGPRSRAVVILDPVVRSTSGAALLDPEGLAILREQLLGQVDWVTPNLEELALLIGADAIAPGPGSEASIVAAAHRLQQLAQQLENDGLNIVVTGGHLDRPDDFLLTANGEEFWLRGKRIVTQATHGTGCAFSSSLLCELIAGQDPHTAAVAAKAYVTEALQSAYSIGKGKGPLNHLFSFRK